ncbi:MAG: hypothetical protein JU82_04915 [Sulfuricurvum sp. MLSB]|nr:MAG: hypothetical protein JU82_04915 [Sulfuricurvum sp. MLSB]
MAFMSIQRFFFNLKAVLLGLGAGVALLTLQLFHISEYGERLNALKHQHLLIDKIINTDLTDPKMASILINGAMAELSLAVKLSGEEVLLDSFVTSGDERSSLLRSLGVSSKNFEDNALIWSESPIAARDAYYARVMTARTAYLADIDRMLDYQIHAVGTSIATAKISAIIVFLFGLAAFLYFRIRLNHIYDDINRACSVDVDGAKHRPKTREIDYILKQLSRKSSQVVLSSHLTHPISGLHNDRGLLNTFNTKKTGKAGNTVFLCIFEIDQYALLNAEHTQEDKKAVYKKLAEMISLYEQPMDIIAHTEDDRLIFVMSRATKQEALDECEHIVKAVHESTFLTAKGAMRLTLSAGFLLKTPLKSLDEAIADAVELIELAKENGGNRVAKLREQSDTY